MKTKLLTLFLFSIFTFVQAQDEPEDFKIISQLLLELEQRDWFPDDIYPIMPPPPESRKSFIKLREDLTPEQADSLFTRIDSRYEQYMKAISERQIDSSFIYLATDNYLSGEKCKWCGIKPDTLLQDSEYSRYKQLAKRLIKGKMKNLEIPFDALNYAGKYRLKSVDEFPSREEMYRGTLNFLSGGELNFSRFYKKEDLGLIYFSMSYCKMDCTAGYMVLYERKNGEWRIFDILLQWIT
jgi:hypothetical protein